MLINRRAFLFAAAAGPALLRAARAAPALHVDITLQPRVAARSHELINLAVPFAPGQLQDPACVQVLDPQGRELPTATRALEIWRQPPDAAPDPAPSIRSVQLQFAQDLSSVPCSQVRVVVGPPRPRPQPRLVPVEETLIDSEGLHGPRVLALLPAAWLCRSGIAGPQVPAQATGAFSAYDRLVARSFPRSLRSLSSQDYSHWLFDRPTAYYKQYLRSGAAAHLTAAGQAAHFMRVHTATLGPDAGAFTLKKTPDLKYVYPRAMHLHYLLSGDDRARAAGALMAAFCLTRWDPQYAPERYAPPASDADPEQHRLFWSPRHQAYGLLGVLHGWELTGDARYWSKARAYADALAQHQAHPPDGAPADGSWRQDWALLDPSETRLPAATSPWMTAILLDALFHYWLLSGDARVPGMVTRWCDFLDRKGFTPDGSRVFYVVDCLGSQHLRDAPDPQEQGIQRHSLELAHSFAMGFFFARDARQRARFGRRCERLFAVALTINANAPVRCYGWAFQASSQLLHFMRHPLPLQRS